MALPLPETSVADLTYEQARLELLSIVTKLERRDLPLEDTLPLWHRADALARHCQVHLDEMSAAS